MIAVHVVGDAGALKIPSCPISQAQVVVVIDGDERVVEHTASYEKPTLLVYTGHERPQYHLIRKNIIDVVSRAQHRTLESFQAAVDEHIIVAQQANTENLTITVDQLKNVVSNNLVKIIVIASSTGGPSTLEHFLSSIPSVFPVPIVIVQHIPDNFAPSLARSLNDSCALPVSVAVDGEQVKDSHIYIAQGGKHLTLECNTDLTFKYVEGEKECGVKPCANWLFRSAAECYGEKVIAVVLTGMGKDGTEGAREIKKRGGTVLAQDMLSSVIYGMPKEVVMQGLVDAVVPLDKMAITLTELIGE